MAQTYAGRVASIQPLVGVEALSQRDARAILVAAGDVLVITEGELLRVYELLSGDDRAVRARLTWEHQAPGPISEVIDYRPGSLILAVQHPPQTDLYVVDATAARVFGSLPGAVSDLAVANNRLLASVENPSTAARSLVLLDAASGQPVWTTALETDTVSFNAGAANDVLMIDRQRGAISRVSMHAECGVVAIGAEHGERSPTAGIFTGRGDVVIAEGSLVTAYGAGDLDRVSGQVHFDWSVANLTRAGTYVVGTDESGGHLAVLDPDTLQVIVERAIGGEGSVIVAAVGAPRIVTFDWQRTMWEHLDLSTPSALLPAIEIIPAAPAPEMVFFGQTAHALTLGKAPTIGTARVLALPVIEPGQSFGDANLDKFGDFMRPQSLDMVRAYYDEATFDQLDMRIDLFGYDVADPATPLTLPKSIRGYFYPPFTPGGLTTTVNAGASPYDVAVDGTESLRLRIQRRVGSPVTLDVPLCALGLTRAHDAFPVTLQFTGSEQAQLDVTDRAGVTHLLSLVFPAQTIAITAANVELGLDALAAYLTDVVRTAEVAAGVAAGSLMAPVEVRRVKRNGYDFGSLETNLRFAPTAGGNKGRIVVSAHSGLGMIGFTALSPGTFSLGLDASRLDAYLERALRQAESDAGFDFTTPLLSGTTVTFDTASTTLRIEIRLSDEVGGPGAAASVLSQFGLSALGFATAVSVPGSTSTKNNQNTLRDSQQLADDVFTAALDRLGGSGAISFFQSYHAILIAFVGAPPASLPAAQRWAASQPDVSGLRMFKRYLTAKYEPAPSTTLQVNWIGTILDATPDNATMAHELGHVLGFDDIYFATGFRDDLLYMGNWSMMDNHGAFSHFCGYHKRAAGWIPASRVIPVAKPSPVGPTSKEALLVPVEYWDAGMEAAVRAVFGGSLPIGQLMKIDLGGDGIQFDLIEARQAGLTFSQNLPSSAPALVISNGLQPNDDTRYAQNFKYRRKLHRLSGNLALTDVSDVFDLAAAPELAAKGVVATIVDRRDVTRPYGVVTVFRVRVDREQADYIDLSFTETTPSWHSPDLWVDWAGDNSSSDPDDHRVYPVGQPRDQGETVHYPSSGTELHWIVSRVWNRGTVDALNVEVNVYRCVPPGSGDKGNFTLHDTRTIDTIPPNDWRSIPVPWNVDHSTNAHQCLRAEIADWELPTDPADAVALASDDVWLVNNWAQQNVNEFIALKSSPYKPIAFTYSLSNEGLEAETVFLEPEWLPYGAKLTVSPRTQIVAPDETTLFHCLLELDETIVDSDDRWTRDPEFLLVAWRTTEDAQERWGGCKYIIRPRRESGTDLNGDWSRRSLRLHGFVAPDPGAGHVLIRIAVDGGEPRWIPTSLIEGGSFLLDVDVDEGASRAEVVAQFEGNHLFGPSRSEVLELYRPA
jgi:hypothetical protein